MLDESADMIHELSDILTTINNIPITDVISQRVHAACNVATRVSHVVIY